MAGRGSRRWVLRLLAAAVMASAAPGAEAAILLIETDPFGATARVGERAPVDTPALLRDLPEGSTSILIEKPGFEPQWHSVVLEEARVIVLTVELEPKEYLVAFPDAGEVDIAGERSTAPYLRIPEGTVTVTPADTAVLVEPVYPRQDLLDGLKMAIPVTAALTAIIAALEWSSPREPVPRVSPAVATGFATTVGFIGATVGLHVQSRRFAESYAVAEEQHTAADAETLMVRIDETIARGELVSAQELLGEFLRQHPEDPRVSRVLYLRGQLYLLSGQSENAARALRLLMLEYPTREYHDRAALLLAGIETERGNLDAAEEYRRARLFPE